MLLRLSYKPAWVMGAVVLQLFESRCSVDMGCLAESLEAFHGGKITPEDFARIGKSVYVVNEVIHGIDRSYLWGS